MLDAAAKPHSTECFHTALYGTADTQSSTLSAQRGTSFALKPCPPTVDKPKNIRNLRPFITGPPSSRVHHSKSKSMIQNIQSPSELTTPETQRNSKDFFNTTWKLSQDRIWKPLDLDQKSPFKLDLSKAAEMRQRKSTRDRSNPQITYMSRRISNNSPAPSEQSIFHGPSLQHEKRTKSSMKSTNSSMKTTRERYEESTHEEMYELHSHRLGKNKREFERHARLSL
jgi:hypothetical protein